MMCFTVQFQIGFVREAFHWIQGTQAEACCHKTQDRAIDIFLGEQSLFHCFQKTGIDHAAAQVTAILHGQSGCLSP